MLCHTVTERARSVTLTAALCPLQVQILAPVTNNSAAYTLASRLNTLVPSGELKATIASASGASTEVSDVSSDYASFYIALTTLTAAAQAEATPAPKCKYSLQPFIGTSGLNPLTFFPESGHAPFGRLRPGPGCHV